MKPSPIITDDPSDSRAEVSALARGLAVLHTVATRGPMTIKDLAASTAIPKATVSRLVATLLSAGYLRQDEGSPLCRIGPAFLFNGNAFLGDMEVRGMVRPYLQNLANLSGAKVNIGIRNGLDIVIIDSIRPRDAVILSYIEIGARMPLATSAAGRAYLASLNDDDRLAVLEDIRISAGSSWPGVAERLNSAFAESDERGYCTSFGEWHPDINAIGLALRGSHGRRFALSCGGPAYKHTPEFLRQQVAPAALRELADWTWPRKREP